MWHESNAKGLWNQMPLHHPASNRVPVLREAGGTTWQLGLESFSSKDSKSLAQLYLYLRDASGWVWGFIFSMKLVAMARTAIDGVELMADMMVNGFVARWVGVRRFGQFQCAANGILQIRHNRGSPHHFLFTPCGSLHVIKRLWNQMPLCCPASNRVPMLRKAGGTTWWLGLESFSNKDSNPLARLRWHLRDASTIFVSK